MATPTPLTYNGLVTQVALLAPYQTALVNGVLQGAATDAAFTALIPMMLNYAEQRIMRDLDLQAMRGGASNVYTMVTGNPTLVIPFADFVTLEQVLAYYNGQYNPVLPVSLAYLYNCGASPGPPKVFGQVGGFGAGGLSGNILQLGPGVPDTPYAIYIFGTRREPSLNTFATTAQANVGTTWISTWLPDLLVMACMIYVSGYQRDFGRQSDDPQMALSYESQYQSLLKPIDREESKKRFEADSWTSRQASNVATPTRT